MKNWQKILKNYLTGPLIGGLSRSGVDPGCAAFLLLRAVVTEKKPLVVVFPELNPAERTAAEDAPGGWRLSEIPEGFVLTDLEDKKLFYDSKTILQEIVQADKNEEISYHLIREEGPDHNKSFYVEVKIGEKSYGSGQGRTKKAAEQKAAYEAILELRKQK